MIKVNSPNKLTIFNSILAGIFVNTKCVTIILDNILNNYSGSIMTTIYILLALIVISSVILFQKKKVFVYNLRTLSFSLLLLLLYSITNSFIAPPFTQIQYFLIFTIFALILPSLITVDTKIFLRTIMYSSIPGIFFIQRIFILDVNNVISMGTSYAFLLPVIATLVYLTFYLKYDVKMPHKFLCLISVISCIVYLLNMMKYGSRGPMFCIISYLIYICCFKYKNNSIMVKRNRLLVIFFTCVIFYFSFIPLLLKIEDILFNVFELRFVFISKFISLGEENLTNGRTSLYEVTLDGILSNPLFGNGMDLFYHKTGDAYPHNFILQMTYDLGIIFTIIFIRKVLLNMKRIIKFCSYDYYSMIVVLFFSSVPGALFSSNLWNNIILWVFFGTAFSNTFVFDNSRSRLKKPQEEFVNSNPPII